MIPISHQGPGMTFGELALMGNEDNPAKTIKRAATVRCVTNCKFLTLSKTDFASVIKEA